MGELMLRVSVIDSNICMFNFCRECGRDELYYGWHHVYVSNIKENLKPFNATFDDKNWYINFETEQDYMFFKLRYV